ncbi:MAG TPA: hypothetical protein VNP93_06820 [Gaiellaceae bacterium]|nr:hypothetical protein [Gaiellaceae bacterium]
MLGESHGIAETATAILSLVRALGIRSLALEWSFDEVGGLVRNAVETGRFDLDELWAIPAGGDLFSGDGRFTAGHVRVLEHLVLTGTLADIVPIDRLDRDPPLDGDRELDMAECLLAALRPELPMLAVVGFFHAAREPFAGTEPMFVHLERALPGLGNGVLERPDRLVDHPVDAVFRLPRATPAVVPAPS